MEKLSLHIMIKQQNILNQKPRQAVSGVIASVVLIGITVAMAALVLTFGTEFTQNVLVIEPIDVKKLTIKNTGSASYIHVTVKNSGTMDLMNVNAIILGSDISGIHKVKISTGEGDKIITGTTSSVTTEITGDDDEKTRLPYGKEVLVLINATTSDGPVEIDPITVRVSKN